MVATMQGAQSHALWHAWAQLEEQRGEPRVVRYLYKRGLEVLCSGPTSTLHKDPSLATDDCGGRPARSATGFHCAEQ